MTTQTEPQPWQEMLTDEQRRFFNAICGDLGKQVIWHGGLRLDKDDYRHMISGTVLGFRTMPGIDLGDGKRGWIMLGGSSLKLNKAKCGEAITIALHIGDHPEEQGLKCEPVRWCDAVLLGLGFNPADFREAA